MTSNNRNWLAERLSKPLDRLWLSGVLAVNAMVWTLLGAQYIATFLIGYFFVFVLCLRARIQTTFPSTSTHLYADKNRIINPKSHHPPKLQKKLYLRWILLSVFGVYLFAVTIPWDTLNFPKLALGTLIPNAIVNYLFIVQHNRLFSGLNGDCFLYRTSAYRAEKYSEIAEYWVSSIAFLRPIGLIVVAFLLWCGVLWGYAIDAHWLFDENTTTGELVMPSVVNLLLFEFCFVALIGMERQKLLAV